MEGYYSFNQIGDGIFRITSKENVFMDLFVGNEKALLFDTGYGFGNLKEEIRKITNLPLIIVNSHGHLDHTNGNFQFEEEIYIHEKDVELCKLHNNVEWRTTAINGGKNTEDFITHDVSNILPTGFDEVKYINQGTGNLSTTKEGDIFDLGGKSLRVIEFPGHTSGSIALLLEESEALYVGDSMNSFVWLFGPEAEKLNVYIKSLYKAKEINFKTMYFGHAPFPGDKGTLDNFIECAENVDFENGIPFNGFIESVPPARICPRKGFGPMDFMIPGFASVVINQEHL